MSDHHGGKGYTPLPQSISNTDTEDEDDSLAQSNEAPKVRVNDALPQSTTNIHENGVYYPLDETRNLANRTKNGQNMLKYYGDDIPIMVVEGNEQNDLWKRQDMSPLRRFCLLASVLLCVVTIIIFLYVLPCDNSMVCPSVNEPRSSVSWDKTLQGVELLGPISIIHGDPSNLIFLVRGQQYKGNDTNDEQGQISADGGGVMSMQGNSGLPLWLVSLKRPPTEIDCTSVDTDRSGKPDCIVAGEQGLLASIKPIAGIVHWSSTIHTYEKLPLILPDIDSDGVEDFLSIEIAAKNMSNLVLLSGGTGQLLGRYSPRNCSLIDIYNRVSNSTVAYVCHDDNKQNSIKTMTVKGLLHAMKLSQYKKLITKSTMSFRKFQSLISDEEKNNWRPTPYHYLSIENEGPCPGEYCRASVNLTLQKPGNQPIVIMDHVSPNSFLSKPAFLVMPGKPYASGFAIKLWQWSNSMSDHTKKVSTVIKRRLIERVLIVVFVNNTDVQVMNPSQSDIVQLCRNGDCQPNLNSRARFSSIKTDYISDDGFPELITYWSSYDVESPKVLTSKVQVVKLDSLVTGLPHTKVLPIFSNYTFVGQIDYSSS